MLYKNFIRPALFKLDAEQAHDYTYRLGTEISSNGALLKLIQNFCSLKNSQLKQSFFGLNFDSPVGLAAGFDKNAHLIPLMQSLGFGFVEIGSITTQASNGNPRPRLLRLPSDEALINRMGLNNDGAEIIVNRVSKTLPNVSIPVGINIAKSHNPKILGDAAIDDYITSFKLAQDVANYITINISCPNTEEGKTFEDPEALKSLIQAINSVRTYKCPILMKLSSDLTLKELDNLLKLCEDGNIDGYVQTNTSSSRERLSEMSNSKAISFGRGGLSGAPLFDKMITLVKHTYKTTDGIKPIFAVGGINSPEKALTAMLSGASLVQIYTGLIYEGPFLVNEINKYLNNYLKENQLTSLKDVVGSNL